MQKETIPTAEYIKALSCRFDLGTVFNLNLSNKSITKLSAITSCVNLVVLNLSKNNLFSLNDFDKLTKLAMLDISFNQITSVEQLTGLSRLTTLIAQGNQIEIPNNLEKWVGSLKSISKIYFQEISGNNTNPICFSENYRDNMFKYAKTLRSLDGSPPDINIIDTIKNIDFKVPKEINANQINFDFKSKQNLFPFVIIVKIKRNFRPTNFLLRQNFLRALLI